MKQARGPKKKEGGFLHAGLLKRNCYSDVHQESTREDQGRKTFPTLIWPRKSVSSVCALHTQGICMCCMCISAQVSVCLYTCVSVCMVCVLVYMAGGAVNVCVLWGLRCSHTLWAMLGQVECCWTLQKRAFSPPEGPLFSLFLLLLFFPSVFAPFPQPVYLEDARPSLMVEIGKGVFSPLPSCSLMPLLSSWQKLQDLVRGSEWERSYMGEIGVEREIPWNFDKQHPLPMETLYKSFKCLVPVQTQCLGTQGHCHLLLCDDSSSSTPHPPHHLGW